MKSKFDNLILVDTPYRPNSGSFARSRKIVDGRHYIENWIQCREIFHNICYNLKLFFLSHDADKGENIANFMRVVESRLGLDPVSEYGPTQRRTILWARPSKWWISYGMRRSLFTCLLRAGSNYNPSKDNFKECIESDQYLKNTTYALERFLQGNTKYVGRKRGWHKQFNDAVATKEDIDKLLVNPENLNKRHK